MHSMGISKSLPDAPSVVTGAGIVVETGAMVVTGALVSGAGVGAVVVDTVCEQEVEALGNTTSAK